jgi:hypothetical protein
MDTFTDKNCQTQNDTKAGLGTNIFCIDVGRSSTQSVNRYACQIIIIIIIIIINK